MTLQTHESLPDEPDLTPGSERSFALVFAFVFFVVAVWPFLSTGYIRIWSLVLAVCLLSLGFLRPSLLRPLNYLWFRFGLLLHKIINPLTMALIFYGAILPTGLVMRALGKDLLRLKKDPQALSYWIVRTPPGPPKGTMHNQF